MAASETSPLLGDVRDEAAPPSLDGSSAPALTKKTTVTTTISAVVNAVAHPPRLSQRYIATYLNFIIIFTMGLGINTLMPAFNSRLEDILCRHQFHDLTLDDPRCKGHVVQGQLSTILGWQTSLESIPAILFTLPYGIMADKVGRKPVLVLSIVSLALNVAWQILVLYLEILPSYLYFSALFSCFGSFPSVGPAMTFTILADVTPQADRANCYFALTAALLLAELIGSPLAGALLIISDWITILVSSGLLVSAVLISLAVPETLNFNPAVDAVVPPPSPEVVAGSDGDENAAGPGKAGMLRQILQTVRADAHEAWVFVFGNRRLLVLMLCFSLLNVGRFVQDLLLQYATKRYHWSWSQAAFLLTIRGSTNLVLCLFVLPAVSVFCMRKLGMPPLVKDLFLARISAGLLLVGALLIAFAATPQLLSFALVIFSMGCGFHSVARSLLNAFVEAHHQAILNSVLGLLEFSGLLVAGPGIFGALQKGIELGGLWIGLPFFIAAAMTAIGFAVVCFFRIPPSKLAEEPPESEA